MSRPTLRGSFVLIVIAFVEFALSPIVRAQLPAPPPDGGYLNGNTAEGDNALFNLTTGINNTANGYEALHANTIGYYNTATGAFALYYNTTGHYNAANGASALYMNTNGANNTANGFVALYSNTSGNNNTAIGFSALYNNTTGGGNTAEGFQALTFNTTGVNNTANGIDALSKNTTGNNNIANGVDALYSNTTGSRNTAEGVQALFSNTKGINNTAIGNSAGTNLTTGSNNIDIGSSGVAGESNNIRIGTDGTQTKTFIAGIKASAVSGVTVFIDSTTGQLGVTVSSGRFKDDIKPMDKASEAILGLKPVTFHYKHEIDPRGIPQFGLIAEQVEKMNPDLVARDAEGKVFTVRYEAVNAMLLNEFLKEHRKVEDLQKTITQVNSTAARQEETITELKAAVAQQQNEMKALAATLQKPQLQRVSDKLEGTRPAPQVAVNNQ